MNALALRKPGREVIFPGDRRDLSGSWSSSFAFMWATSSAWLVPPRRVCAEAAFGGRRCGFPHALFSIDCRDIFSINLRGSRGMIHLVIKRSLASLKAINSPRAMA